jgi:hypothetical protein
VSAGPETVAPFGSATLHFEWEVTDRRGCDVVVSRSFDHVLIALDGTAAVGSARVVLNPRQAAEVARLILDAAQNGAEAPAPNALEPKAPEAAQAVMREFVTFEEVRALAYRPAEPGGFQEVFDQLVERRLRHTAAALPDPARGNG